MELGGLAVAAVLLATATLGCVGSDDRPVRARLATAIDARLGEPHALGDATAPQGATRTETGPSPQTSSWPTCHKPTLVDCRAPENYTRLACKTAREVPTGALGRGFSPAAIDGDVTYGGGFVDCSHLIVATSSEREGYGLVLSVDLVTGDRRIVSGSYGHGRARHRVGSSHAHHERHADLEGVRDVARGPDGSYYAFVTQPAVKPNVVRVVRIDATTGNRTAVVEWRKGHDGFGCDAASANVELEPSGFAMAPDGAMYFAARDTDGGIGVVGLTDAHGCRIVSRTSRASVRNIGEGPAFAAGLAFPRFAGGKVWALDGLGLVAIDVRDGTRTRVSSAQTSPPIGGGEDFGSTSLALSKRRAWTAGGATYPAVRLTLVDLETGERHGFRGISGPLADPGLGTRIWHYENSGVAVVSVGGGFAFFDPKTSVSNLFSR
ncbi:MAG: hypothetical protein JWP87_3500 [Labilithrix sp.]|nr:hypothetical protein [Labilithrix sp.]